MLDQPGEHSRAMRHLRFTSVDQIDEMEAIVRAYIGEAIALEKAGASADFSEGRDIRFPVELQKKLDENPALKTAFDALTPGRQRAYILEISDAKQSKTRAARVEKYMPQILDGLGLRD